MHGIVEAFGMAILLSGVASLAVTFLTGLNTVKGALVGLAILLIAVITLASITWHSPQTAAIELPIILAAIVLGLFGGLPGAALGGWLRRKVRRES